MCCILQRATLRIVLHHGHRKSLCFLNRLVDEKHPNPDPEHLCTIPIHQTEESISFSYLYVMPSSKLM